MTAIESLDLLIVFLAFTLGMVVGVLIARGDLL